MARRRENAPSPKSGSDEPEVPLVPEAASTPSYLTIMSVVVAVVMSVGILYALWSSALHPPLAHHSSVQHHDIPLQRMVLKGGAAHGSISTSELTKEKVSPIEDILENVRVSWQLPSEAALKGIILAFHGCGHAGRDFFVGPEERRMVNYALGRGYAFVAMSCQQRHKPQCWDGSWPPEENVDVKEVSVALDKWLRRQALKGAKLPVYAVGASSGGTFTSIFLHSKRLAGACIMIAPAAGGAVSSNKHVASWPPTAFVYMPRDKQFAGTRAIQSVAKQLKEQHVPVEVLACPSHPLTRKYLHTRVGVSPNVSSDIYEKLKSLEHIDSQGFLTQDPRGPSIMPVAELAIDQKSDIPEAERYGLQYQHKRAKLLDALQEEFNVLYGMHEITSEHWHEVIDFWDRTTKERATKRVLE